MRRLALASMILAPALSGVLLAATVSVDGPMIGAVPRAVTIAEGLAEDVQTDLDAGHWTMAHSRIAELQKNRSVLRQTLPASNIAVYGVALDSLISQADRQDRTAALQSANRMSRALVSIMAGYDVTIPLQVSYLDVAGRDAIYASEAKHWQDVSSAAAELRANYAVVRDHVASKDSTLDRRVRQRLNELDAASAAKSPARVRSIATALLDDVDLIEAAF